MLTIVVGTMGEYQLWHMSPLWVSDPQINIQCLGDI